MIRLRPSALAAPLIAAALFAPTTAVAGPHRYLVVPFENLSRERSLNWIGDALALSLADRLELLGMRTAGRGERLDALESLGLPDGKPLSLASASRLAAAVRADRLVTGTFNYDPNVGVVVSGMLLDPRSVNQIWEGTHPGALARILSLMDPLVLEAAAKDTSRLSPADPSTLGTFSDPPLTVYETLVKALLEPEPERRLAALQKALGMDRRSTAIRRAIAFEQFDGGRLAEALATLDGIAADQCPDGWRLHLLRARILAAQGNLDAALQSLSKSIAAGDSADAHLLLARLSSTRGETARARAEIEIARGLDPGNPELASVGNVTPR